ncbi:hypothetical protein EG329_001226 [Mollisiaceae sp. DMI_Dod_QoI]|nr:hypothetical protein EG329_001226 [Helotiales sp. DMI_Dod_QoI]
MSHDKIEVNTKAQQPKSVGAGDPSPFATPTLAYDPRSHTKRDSCFWRKLVKTAISTLQHRGVTGGILKIPYTPFCIKYGHTIQLSEATALQFVRQATSIPVPKVYCAFREKDMTYIVMEKIDGEEIGKGWAERPEAERQSLLQQLRVYFDELRSIPHPHPGSVAGAHIQPLWEPRTYKGNLGFGPFANERDFNMFLRYGFQNDDEILGEGSMMTDEERSEISRLIRLQDEGKHKTCFTHGDASSSNILVKKGKVVALIDFEMSGFYPEYWEYANAINVNRFDGFWAREVGKFLHAYPKEVEMEAIRRKHFGYKGFRGHIMYS